MRHAPLAALLTLVPWPAIAAPALPPGTHERVTVTRNTSLDWVFTISNQSPDTPPADWTRGYESTKQGYRLLVPAGIPQNPDARTRIPLVLFISPGDNPGGLGAFGKVARQRGMLVASPHEAGNRCPFPRRVHIVLDVLDDLRRRYPIDPDRTYLAGFSGGGRVACTIGFALPELFGGVVSFCAAGDLRPESWLRHRVINRLSVALVTGETDFNRGEVERFRGPLLSEVGVRTRVWVEKGVGHAVPGLPIPEVVKWLEADRPRRARYAEEWPGSRLPQGPAPGRQETAQRLLEEARKRTSKPATVYSGLMQLKGVRVRFSGTPESVQAERTLLEYDSRDKRPWELEDIAEQRRFLVARARSIDAYGSGHLPPQYAAGRVDMLKFAVALWMRIQQDGQDKKAVQQAQKRIPVLKKRIAEIQARKRQGQKEEKGKTR